MNLKIVVRPTTNKKKYYDVIYKNGQGHKIEDMIHIKEQEEYI